MTTPMTKGAIPVDGCHALHLKGLSYVIKLFCDFFQLSMPSLYREQLALYRYEKTNSFRIFANLVI